MGEGGLRGGRNRGLCLGLELLVLVRVLRLHLGLRRGGTRLQQGGQLLTEGPQSGRRLPGSAFATLPGAVTAVAAVAEHGVGDRGQQAQQQTGDRRARAPGRSIVVLAGVAGEVVLVVIPRASLPSRSPEESSLLRDAAVAWAMLTAFCLLSALAVMVRTRVSGGLVTVSESDRSVVLIFSEVAAGSRTFGLVESSTRVGMRSLAWVEKEGVSFDLGWMPRVVVATASGLVDRATPSRPGCIREG